MGPFAYAAAAADDLIWAHYFLKCAADALESAYGHTANGFAWAHYFYRMRSRMGTLVTYATNVAVSFAWAHQCLTK
jgi:hypothetical protein